jgi:hypothetical protein
MKIQIFDPAMCCSTGVCGPALDPELVRFSADVEWLKGRGIEVERHGLAQEPRAFAEHSLVKAELAEHGTECLPIVLLNGRVIAEGKYPGRGELEALVDSLDSARPAEEIPSREEIEGATNRR